MCGISWKLPTIKCDFDPQTNMQPIARHLSIFISLCFFINFSLNKKSMSLAGIRLTNWPSSFWMQIWNRVLCLCLHTPLWVKRTLTCSWWHFTLLLGYHSPFGRKCNANMSTHMPTSTTGVLPRPNIRCRVQWILSYRCHMHMESLVSLWKWIWCVCWCQQTGQNLFASFAAWTCELTPLMTANSPPTGRALLSLMQNIATFLTPMPLQKPNNLFSLHTLNFVPSFFVSSRVFSPRPC